jgi:hypothetical protein
VANLNPLKHCFRCGRSKPRRTFRSIAGSSDRRQMCAECFDRLAAETAAKAGKSPDAADIERAVYDGMQDLRTESPRRRPR